jgi:hypothetical protein
VSPKYQHIMKLKALKNTLTRWQTNLNMISL